MRKRRLAVAAALSACIAGLLLPGCAAFEGDPSDPTVQQQRRQDTAASDTAAGARETAAPTATRRGRSVEARIEAASRAARIKMALVEERSLRTFDFEPRVTGGRVVLAGNVATRAQGETAAEVARGVEGIDDVRNRLTVAGQPVTWSEPAPGEPSLEDPPRVASSPQGAARGGEDVHHHTVEPGESLWTIADRYGTTVGRLKALNDLRSGRIRAGERLQVGQGAPGRAAGAGEERGSAPLSFYKGGASGPDASSSRTSDGNASEPAAGSEDEAAEYYVVKRGESLWTIAQKNGTSVARLKELNSLASNSLMPGDRLRVE